MVTQAVCTLCSWPVIRFSHQCLVQEGESAGKNKDVGGFGGFKKKKNQLSVCDGSSPYKREAQVQMPNYSMHVGISLDHCRPRQKMLCLK